MSTESAGLAAKMGYKNIKVMLQGTPGWKKSGRQLVAGHDFVTKGNIVLIDLRPAAEARESHIPRAVNIPLAELANAEDDFPENPTAPIVLYGKGDDGEKGAKIVKSWGFKAIALVDGGLAGYVAAGHQPARDRQPETEIVWIRKPGDGEVLLEEFRQAMDNQKPGQVILDVRTNDEVKEGKLTGAIAIPLDELEARMAELPKDKEILVHCTTGARAEMAHGALKKAGLTSRFLVAEVECEDGACTLEE